MTIYKQTHCRCRTGRKILIVIALLSIVFGYAVNIFISLPLPHVIVNLSSIHQHIMFTHEKVYFLNGVAYDFYSIDELDNHSGPGLQWKTFPLPNEQIPAIINPWTPRNHLRKEIASVSIPALSTATTGLAFVDHIYITSTPNLIDRQVNLEKILTQYQITNYEWRLKWTRETCNAPNNKEEIYRKLNLRAKQSIGSYIQQRKCSLTMKHVDIWHDIVARNSTLSLILEDDAVFVSNFREKFDRTIYTAIRTGALKIGELSHCVTNKPRLSATSNEWFEQDPVIVIGSCLQYHDKDFAKTQRDAQPMLSMHKEHASRCSHAYLLTACSAQALIHQIAVRKNLVLGSDSFLDAQVAASPTLQSFWLDPPIVYQGNQIHDLDEIPSFTRTTY